MTFRDATYKWDFSSANFTINVPAGAQEGDALLLFFVCNGVQTLTAPSGWTTLGPKKDTSSASHWAFGKVATASDIGGAATVATSGGAALKSAGVLAAYSQTDSASPVHQWSVLPAASSSTSHGVPAVTTTQNNCQILTAITQKDTGGTSMTEPEGFSKRGTVPAIPGTSGQATAWLADDAALKAAGTYGSGNWVSNISSGNAVVWTVALAPLTTSTSARPAVDITTAGWSAVPAPGAGVQKSSVLADNNATTYIESASNATDSVFETKLGAMTGAPFKVAVTAQSAGGATVASVKTELVQGTTVVASWPAETALPETATLFEYTLTADQRAACTDLADLRLRWTVTVA